jgi:hypothetical protein
MLFRIFSAILFRIEAVSIHENIENMNMANH